MFLFTENTNKLKQFDIGVLFGSVDLFNGPGKK